jgi:hypothetical protein
MDSIINVDLRETLTDIAKLNTFYHLENDIQISFEQMERAVRMEDYLESTLIWVSYPSGIDCHSEREVLQKITRGYNVVQYHGESAAREPKLAYAVEVCELKNGSIFGNIYEIDIHEYAKYARDNAITTNSIQIYLDDSLRKDRYIVMPIDEFNSRYPLDLPKMTYWRNVPSDHATLNSVINKAMDMRLQGYRQCRLWDHTDKLYDNRLLFHADKLINGINKHKEPNSHDKQSFTVPVDTYIAENFGPEQLSRILDKLPYKNAALTVRKGQHSMILIVPKSEVLSLRREQGDKPKEPPDILEQLETYKREIKQRDSLGRDTQKRKDKEGR